MDTHLYTMLLGFILRSTNVRNAFEIQDPLKRIVLNTVRTDARLILSSEWNYMPATYPMKAPALQSTVFVNNPAQESKYALYFSISGHEIGHSVWRHHKIELQISAAVTQAINAIQTPTQAGSSVDKARFRNRCLAFAMRQLEEVFCDIYAVGVFGEAYAYAYDYYVGPGMALNLDINYPLGYNRNRYIIDAAKYLGTGFDQSIFSDWCIQSRPNDLLFHTTDAAVDSIVQNLIQITAGLLNKLGVSVPDESKIISVLKSFERNVPYDAQATLPEILSAGWRYLRTRSGLGDDEDEKRFNTLNEVILKSIEISDFIRLTD